MGSTLRHAYNLLGRENRFRWVALAGLALVASGFEVLGAALVYVLLGLVADPDGEIELPVVGDVRTFLDVGDEQDLLLLVLAAMGIFFILRAVVQVAVKYLQQRVAHNAGARLSNQLVEGYLRWPYAVHLQRTSAELIRNANQAVKQLVGQVFIPAIRVLAETVMITGMLVLLVAIAPAATALAVLVIGSAAGVLLLMVQPRLKRLGRTAHRLSGETLATLQQSLHGVRDIKILGRERYFAREYGRRRLRFARAAYVASTIKDLPVIVIELALLGFILVYFAITVVAGSDGQSALSVLGLFAYAGLRMQPSLQKIIAGFNELKFAAAPLADLDADLTEVKALQPLETEGEPVPFRSSLVLDDVSFRYSGASGDALREIKLDVRPGEQIGICGPTGGGKTTLVDIIAGLLEPTEGEVRIDGVPLTECSRGWQANLGLVSQMVFLIDDSLRRNIALGVPDHAIDNEAVQRAVELAQLQEFVGSLPGGLDSSVGERGIRISGGQRQRIAIARALYRSPEVLIFDEGTSALDNETEAALMSAIENLRGDHTIILVAHRLSTVKSCDRVIFVKDGRIEGAGRFEELLEKHAAFRRLAGLGG